MQKTYGIIRRENVVSIYLRFRLAGIGRSSGEPSSATSHPAAPRFGSMLCFARDTSGVRRIYTVTVHILPTVTTVTTVTTTYFEPKKVVSKSSRSSLSGGYGLIASKLATYALPIQSVGARRLAPAVTISGGYCLLF